MTGGFLVFFMGLILNMARLYSLTVESASFLYQLQSLTREAYLDYDTTNHMEILRKRKKS